MGSLFSKTSCICAFDLPGIKKMKRLDDLLKSYVKKELSPHSNFQEIYDATQVKIRKAKLSKAKKRLASKSNL